MTDLHSNDVYENTISVPTVTHVMIDGNPCAVYDLPRVHGFTYNELLARREADRLRTHCTLGGAALTLEEFEAEHPHIELGVN